jgi:uncharacterized coiled-coil protein SlyX
MSWTIVTIVLMMILAAYLDRRRVLNRQQEFFRIDLAQRDRTIDRLSQELAETRRELHKYKRHVA